MLHEQETLWMTLKDLCCLGLRIEKLSSEWVFTVRKKPPS